ncbi:MAG: GNAT family N-acetyltransferase [Bacillota bacterium]|jgi:GNAT superfamily N-acetyltransferase|nr:GNAT family N-acetyltransferase [Bacillota bacterium]HHU43830.1 GNAT family N-acetyltransferase [Clostridiales bacterium]
MLSIMPTNDKKLLDKMSNDIFSRHYNGDIGYILYVDEKEAGVAQLSIGETSAIMAIGILPDYRKKGYGDFFTRSILFRLSQISQKIKINYVDDYYTKFGFKKKNDYMEIDSKDLEFTKTHC